MMTPGARLVGTSDDLTPGRNRRARGPHLVDLIAEGNGDLLGESEGVQIAVSRESAAIAGRPTVDWQQGTDGKSGFSFLT